MDELVKQKFQMRVNEKTYDVYPDVRSVTSAITVPEPSEDVKNFQKNKIETTLARDVGLSLYYLKMVQELRK